MEDTQQSDDGKEGNQHFQQQAGEIPDLALTLQAMSLAEPGLCRVQNQQVVQEQELDFSFCLLMKVACTGGTPRSISQQALEQAMSRAWRKNFYAISQVSSTVFLAHFRSQEDMLSIYTRQPWAMGSDTMLLDWFDQSAFANSSADYKFDHIFVTIRAYGIPRNRRSLSLLADILNQVGTVSEFHILQENCLFARQDYIWGTAKLKVNTPVKDRAIISYSDNTTGLAYLHYEKIGRICLFCGVMFHNAQHCSLRNNLIAERSRNKQAELHIPTQRFGQWIIDEEYIPAEVIQSTRIGHQGSNQAGSAILSRLQRLFAEDPKGKGKLGIAPTQEQMNSSSQRYFRPYQQVFNAGQTSFIRENPLHISSGTVRTSFTQQGGELDTTMMHEPHLTNPPERSQQTEQVLNTVFTGGQETPSTKEEAIRQSNIPQTYAIEGQRITTGGTNLQESMPIDASSIPDSFRQQQCPNPPLLTDSSPLHLHQIHTHQSQQTMAIPTASIAPLMHKSSPKRPPTSPIPSVPPLAKRASQLTETKTDGAPLEHHTQIHDTEVSLLHQKSSDSTTPPNPLCIPSDQQRLDVTTHIGITTVARGGILGAGPGGEGQSPLREVAAPDACTGDNESIKGVVSTNIAGRTRRRPSGWDVSQFESHGLPPVGITRYQHGSTTWRRLADADELGHGGPQRRSRGTALRHMVHPYTDPPRRSTARSSLGMTGEHDPWTLRPVSPSWSAGTQDSSYGVFSPPQTTHDQYIVPNTALGIAGQESHQETTHEIRSGDSQATGKQDQQQHHAERSMELDNEALAPASKAPRAP